MRCARKDCSESLHPRRASARLRWSPVPDHGGRAAPIGRSPCRCDRVSARPSRGRDDGWTRWLHCVYPPGGGVLLFVPHPISPRWHLRRNRGETDSPSFRGRTNTVSPWHPDGYRYRCHGETERVSTVLPRDLNDLDPRSVSTEPDAEGEQKGHKGGCHRAVVAALLVTAGRHSRPPLRVPLRSAPVPAHPLVAALLGGLTSAASGLALQRPTGAFSGAPPDPGSAPRCSRGS